MKFKVSEIFSSIEGEGIRAGELCTFVRFFGCNLQCSYCDSMYACSKVFGDYQEMDLEEIIEQCELWDNKNVTLTGGEPLIQPGIEMLIKKLSWWGFDVNIETNGSIDVTDFSKGPIYTIDYKCPSSEEESHMCARNFQVCLRREDYRVVYKFVVGSQEDLDRAYDIMMDLPAGSFVYLSPVFGKIEPVEIVKYMKTRTYEDLIIRLQLQMHKFIWDPDKRGV